MSSDQIIFQPNTCQVPNVIFDYWMSRLNESQFKVLLAITRKTLGWHKIKDDISNSQIQKLTGLKETTVRDAANYLVRLGLVIMNYNKLDNGCSLPNTYTINIYEVNQSATPPDKPCHPPTANRATPPRPAEPTKAKTKSTNLKGNALVEETAQPVFSEKTLESPKRKFGLKKEQVEYFNQMKSLDLGCDDDTLIILIRTAWQSPQQIQKLKDCIFHMKYEIAKGTEFKKARIALFRSCLNGKVALYTELSKKNVESAKNFVRKQGFNSLSIKDKYVALEIDGKKLKEVSTNLEEKTFQQLVLDLFKLSKEYQG